MSFADFIKTTVLLCAGAATALGAVTILSAAAEHDPGAATIPYIWWGVAAAIGYYLGGRGSALAGIARLMASARAVTNMPEPRPGLIMLARLWPLLITTLIASVLGIIAPQIPGIATGFAIMSALAWRNQYAAVLGVEGRDGVRFWVDNAPFWRSIRLTRTPGFKVYRPS
jgi:hypothetical protein